MIFFTNLYRVPNGSPNYDSAIDVSKLFVEQGLGNNKWEMKVRVSP